MSNGSTYSSHTEVSWTIQEEKIFDLYTDAMELIWRDSLMSASKLHSLCILGGTFVLKSLTFFTSDLLRNKKQSTPNSLTYELYDWDEQLY